MQIKYRITLVYTIIVSVILLTLCYCVYFFSEQNLEQQFKERLRRKAISTAAMLKSVEITPDLLKQFNSTTPSAFIEKTVIAIDFKYNETFSFNDPGADSIIVTNDLISKTRARGMFFFNIGKREGIALEYKENNFDYIIIVAAYDGDREGWLSKLRLILIISFFTSISAVVVSGYIFSMELVRPISRLTNRINKISSQELSRRLDTGNGKDELNQLAITINNLLARLQLSFETQKRFIDNASHELLTPLASMGSQLDVALQRDRSNEDYKTVISSVHEDVQNLILLVRSLLDIAKISGSPSGIELASVRVDELLLHLPSEMKKINPQYIVRLNFDDLPDNDSLLTVFGNEPLLLCAIRNIVHNACKFSNNKTANVKLYYAGGNVFVTVEDNGYGIDDSEIKNIFQPFYRNKDMSYSVPGSGLGLPLAEHIVRMYGGNIQVNSQQGKGTIFTITLKAE